jgi:hypothetical protein
LATLLTAPTAHTKDEILQNHRSVLDTFNTPVNEMDKYELPYLYSIPKLHKTLTKIQNWIQQMFHQASIPTPHKNINSCEGENQTYCATKYARNGINQI